MPSKEMIGRVLSTGSATVSAEHVAAFARALGDPNPLYVDPEAARRGPFGTISRPAHLPDRLHGAGPGGWRGRLPGARARLHDARPRRAGVRVHAADQGGRDAHADGPHRRSLREAGLERHARLRGARDRGGGRRRATGLLLAQHAHLAEDVIPGLDPKTVAVGHELPPLVKGPITREDLKAYAAASGDPNPMHTDDEFARNAGYPGVFAHGMLSMGYLGEFLVRAGGVGSIRRFRTRFAKLTWPGEVITCRGVVTGVSDDGPH